MPYPLPMKLKAINRNVKTLANVLHNAARPGYLPVMANKALRRLEREETASSAAWARERLVPAKILCTKHDHRLWAEAESWYEYFLPRAQERLAQVDVPMGGAGEVRLLYFLVRWRKPEHVLETGVAAGFSTEAILAAMMANGRGTLHSSDFPYVRLRSPEKHIGILVSDEHKRRWRLHLEGDRRNLPRILDQAPRIGLFHYDSDKSRGGREFAWRTVYPHLEPGAVCVMDDIHNNLFFRNLVAKTNRPWAITGSPEWPLGVWGLD